MTYVLVITEEEGVELLDEVRWKGEWFFGGFADSIEVWAETPGKVLPEMFEALKKEDERREMINDLDAGDDE